MNNIKILEVGHIDNFDTELIIHVELEINDKEREMFGKNIDDEDYLSNCWLVMVTLDKETERIVGKELYYISNRGFEVSDKQLSDIEFKPIESFVLSNEEVLNEIK